MKGVGSGFFLFSEGNEKSLFLTRRFFWRLRL